jgi:hypothetical protein
MHGIYQSLYRGYLCFRFVILTYIIYSQGKPIMARIKAKPMNRLPMPPVPAMGAAMKNGYRTPPAALYDPSAYQGSQQRFLYTNGSSIPPTVNYGNQVHVYVSTINITVWQKWNLLPESCFIHNYHPHLDIVLS